MNIQRSCYAAIAHVSGAGISGTVAFRQLKSGVLVTADITGLPENDTGFFALHIHEGRSCGGEAFADSGAHYNPAMKPHPLHAGDLPPLLASGGNAYLSVLTDRFTVSEIVGRTVVIHDGADDFRSQPAGDSGTKIACGAILCTRGR